MLYDGVCGFCNMSVQAILDHDRRGTMRFAALQSDYARRIIERHPSLRDIDSVVYVERAGEPGRERVYVRSSAALRVASYLGGWWRVLLAGHAYHDPCATPSTSSRATATNFASTTPACCARGVLQRFLARLNATAPDVRRQATGKKSR